MDLWNRILGNLAKRVDQHDFETWLRPTESLGQEGGRLKVRVPNRIFVNWIQENYGELIDELATEIAGAPLQLEFVAAPSGKRAPAAGRAEPSGPAQPQDRAIALNPKYTFDSFVVGASNQFANAAARAVAEQPSRIYNPLYIYGGVGLGKTHLMQAIGHAMLANNPELKLVYIGAERFMNELINSIRYDRMNDFRARYRGIDALLLDDVQFIAGKERTQEEFFHTFNALYDAQKQLVISSDSQPKEISTIEERLRSRFEWGLLADIQSPDLETKVAILKKKAEAERVALPNDVALFIASKVRSNIRELEGLLIRVVAFASLTGNPITIDLTKETLKDILHSEEKPITAQDIQKLVAHHFGLKVSELKMRNNSKQVAFPRQIAMFLCKRLTTLSYPEIGKVFSDKHHSTVIYSVEKIEKLRKEDPQLDQLLDSLTTHLR